MMVVAADKLAQQVAAIEAALPKFISASGALTDALSALSHWHFESGQMATFILNATAQIELASGFSLAELRATVDRVKAGDTPIPRTLSVSRSWRSKRRSQRRRCGCCGARSSVTMQARCSTQSNSMITKCLLRSRSAHCVATLWCL
jgi:hypothetical protein